MTVTVFGVSENSFLYLGLVLSEKIYQTLETVFDHISKHLEVRQKYPPLRVVFSTLFSVFGKCVQTRSFVFDI